MMQYRPFGNTGDKISLLGFGGMRMPNGKDGRLDIDNAVGLIQRSLDLGVNYIDTGSHYCGGLSEKAVGEAVRAYKGARPMVSTKIPLEDIKSKGRGDFRAKLERSLKELGLDFIDYYHFWGIDYKSFQENVLAFGLIEEMLSARDQKLIRHISFSFHGDPEDMIKIIDEGQVFESVLCQYNLLDRSNEHAIAHAHRRGLGVAVMGPVGGGRLGEPSAAIKSLLPDTASSAELALRFVISNPHVSCALSGMSDISQVEENAVVASSSSALTAEELERVNASMEENKRLEELYCTGCDYCMPCPRDVNIPLIFKLMNYHKIYGVTEYARREYLNIGRLPWLKGKPASACAECGVCEPKCPQAIKIRKQLKETASALG